MPRMQGNLISRLMEQSAQPEPKVGMGATITCWSDRHAATIVDIIRFKYGKHAGQPKFVIVQQDRAERTDANGMSDCQTYQYFPNPNAERRQFKYSPSRGCCDGLVIGVRREYHDYSF